MSGGTTQNSTSVATGSVAILLRDSDNELYPGRVNVYVGS